MPPAILAIPGFIAGLTLAEVAMAASIAITIGTTVFGAVQQRAAAKKAKRRAAQAREDFLNSLQDRTVTRIATDAPYRYVYGKARVGADIVAVLSSGANEEYKHLVCVHAAGESESIDEVYINNKALGPLDAEGFVTSGDYYSVSTENSTEQFASSPYTLAHTPSSTVTVIAYGRAYLPNGVFFRNHSAGVAYTRSGNTITITGSLNSPIPGGRATVDGYRVTYQYQRNTSQVRVQKHLGTPDDPADATLLAECGDKWKDTAVLRGFTYTVIRLDLRQAEFQSGVPDINVLMKGRKLYDPRTGVTEWSDNPALVIYDYLRSEMCGVPAADIPLSNIITAANVCDTPVQGLC